MSKTEDFLQVEICTILVVEDEILIRISIAEYLRHCGYRVIETANADEAIIMLNAPDIKIDIVFSDVEMPGSMDGFGLSKWVRSNKPGIEVILTNTVQKAAKEAAELCDEGSVCDDKPHFNKPYEPENLVNWIKRIQAAKK